MFTKIVFKMNPKKSKNMTSGIGAESVSRKVPFRKSQRCYHGDIGVLW